MIVVLASRHDREAHRLAEAWHRHDARVMTPDDLSVAGWQVRAPGALSSRVVVGGDVVDDAAVTGVVTRLMTVPAEELRRVREVDRAYAAREMTAFLGFWLSTLACPVLNPPAAVHLCGPGWRDERWLLTASRLGIAVVPRARGTGVPDRPGTRAETAPAGHLSCTVVGDRCLHRPGSPPPGTREPADDGVAERAAEAALRLARAAGAPLVDLRFAVGEDGPALVSADVRVDVSDPDVRAAMIEHLRGSLVAAPLRRFP
ncbi:hypothetical protein ICW40_02785 [Actinotalea ferrariae]|uniref:hypothetical protein n=1 Tax=Actinotalea ferrariae TaxID=1386098 RepID=UPI001C8C9527|nr:hypothetical protein [Actinotalea ferrariae]MBX9243730.1 hypothetical protein [Actinotalea ferrariae]